jgi:hypothetical protein
MAGTLVVQLAFSMPRVFFPPLTPIDMNVFDGLQERWASADLSTRQLSIQAPVQADATYQIAVVSYESPGVDFELRTSLQP